jgi:hypothetical protein
MHQIKSQEPEVLELAVVQSKLGRKRKLNPAIFEKIMVGIENGERIDPACRARGISERTVFSWIQKDPACARRFAAAKAVRLQGWHEKWLGEMCEHSKHSPAATSWLLERNFPHLYLTKPFTRGESDHGPDRDAAAKDVLLTVPLDEFEQFKLLPDTKVISENELEHVESGVRMTIYLLEQ